MMQYDLINCSMKKIINGWRDKIIPKHILKQSVYSDLTPTDNLSNEEESLKALHWSLSNPKIKNIALTGPYGAGKSSVIASYLKQHKKCKAINISLATFDGKTMDKVQTLFDEKKYEQAQSAQKEFEDELEKGILKQLFYKVSANKIPLSRYRKLHHKNLWEYMIEVLILLIIILSGMYLMIPDYVSDFLELYRNGISSFKEGIPVFAAFLVVLFGFSYVIRDITSKFTVKKISVGDISAQNEETTTDSILNKNIDEMLYFFERTKYNVVFIEDLDRFESTSIFIKLREINTILNNYDVIRKKRKITFVYAVKDDLFQKEMERTKFFDFLIPIIPVINSTNSGEKMRNLLGIGENREESREYPEHDISQKFVTLVSPYIRDMRILINTINEFWIYKRTLKESQDVQLKDENMLALMIYKNLYPNDFALLEINDGDIKDAFKYKEEALKNAKKILENKRRKLERLQKDVAISVKEIKAIILAELTEYNGVVTHITIAQEDYNYSELLADTFSFDLLRKNKIKVYYRPYNSRYETEANTFSGLNDLDERFENLFKRYDIQCELLNKSIEDSKVEVEKINKDILKLRAKTMQQLIETDPIEEVLPENVRKNKLLIFMLRHGYINESYADYINYFYAGSISKEELNFILSIRDFKGESDFGFAIKHCANTVDRLYDYEFEQVEVLNFDLMDFLMDSESNNAKLKHFIHQIVNRSEISKRFIKSYLDRGIKTDKFIQLICAASRYIWKDIENDEQVSSEMKDIYLEKIFWACKIDDIVKNNYVIEDSEIGGMRKYLESDPLILKKLSDVPRKKMQEIISRLNLRFRILNASQTDRVLVDYILEGGFFELNHSMMESICGVIDSSCNGKLFKSNYQYLCELNNEHLLKYVHENFIAYVRNFIIEEESNTEDGLEYINKIIQRIFENNKKLCVEVIKKEYFAHWRNLSECLTEFEDKEKQMVWDCLLKNNKTDATWDNYLIYHNLFGLTDTLLQFLDNNIDMILESSRQGNITDELINELIVKDLSDYSFKKVISKYKVMNFTNEISKFAINKIKIMIQKHYFDFSPEKFIELREISRMLSLELICKNLSAFFETYKQCDLNIKDIKDIIKLLVLEKNRVRELLELINPEEMDRELAHLVKDFDFELPKEYVEAMWQVLDEEDKYQVLYNQMGTFDLDEIAEKFAELGGVYEQFSVRARHKFVMFPTEYNKKLCEKLLEIGFLSSYAIVEDKTGAIPLFPLEDNGRGRIIGYVRKK